MEGGKEGGRAGGKEGERKMKGEKQARNIRISGILI